MSLRIIGAGFGRTGTQSLKTALEYLGYQPCYSMTDVVLSRPGWNDGHLDAWHSLVCEGRSMDWVGLFARYEACLDAPTHYFFREIAEAFPDAAVVLTIRDPQRWFESWRTLQETSERVRVATQQDPRMRKWGELMQVLRGRAFGDAVDQEAVIRVFEKRIEEVKATIAPERLLVFDVHQGWGPLCAFLGQPTPEIPFPHVNDRETLKQAAEAFLAGNRSRESG